MIHLAEVIEKLLEQSDKHFPINNSIIPLLILVKTIRFQLSAQDLSLKAMCTELHCSDLCTRSHIAKLEKNGWLEVNVSHSDRRVKLINATPKLMRSFKLLVNNLNLDAQSLMMDDKTIDIDTALKKLNID